MSLEKPNAIFFDWDGTLVDSFAFLEGAHNHVLASFGMETLNTGAFSEYFGKPREEIYPAMYGDKADEARSRFEDYVINNHTKSLPPVSDAEQLLQAGQQLGITMGVVSNKKPEFVNAEIDHFGWRKYFTTVVGAKEAANDKPSPDPLMLAIQRANVEPQMNRIWYVGDTIIDQKCAKAAQSYFIFVEHLADNEEIEVDEKDGKIVKNCTELSDLLLQYAEKDT